MRSVEEEDRLFFLKALRTGVAVFLVIRQRDNKTVDVKIAKRLTGQRASYRNRGFLLKVLTIVQDEPTAIDIRDKLLPVYVDLEERRNPFKITKQNRLSYIEERDRRKKARTAIDTIKDNFTLIGK